ncbi:MAG: hypothetical protein ACI8ZW_002542, partial [Yoonia sp.]
SFPVGRVLARRRCVYQCVGSAVALSELKPYGLQKRLLSLSESSLLKIQF